jgi:hypothetical protein
MIRFDGIEIPLDLHHTVRDAVWLEVVGFRMLDRMGLDKTAQVGKQPPGPLSAVHPQEPIGDIRIAV